MSFTSLHRALGVQPRPLTFDMLTAAVQQGVTEQEDLDWKEKLPDDRNPDWKEEFAKDVAAMANAGGGLILFGIREDSRSAAIQLVDVGPWSDDAARRLRQAAHALIRPAVQGLEFTSLSDGDVTVVVLDVPASDEVPHIQFRRDLFRAPRRYGAQTVDMTEREIEAAYRRRFDAKMTREKTLDDMHEDVLLGMNRNWVWMVAVALPSRPRPASLGRLDRSIMESVVQAMAFNPYLAPGLESRLQYLERRPRIGFRRWRSVDAIGDDVHGAIEVHDDGSFALALAQYVETERSADSFENGKDIHTMDLLHFPAHAIRLLEAVTTAAGIQGPFELQLNVHSASSPIYLRTYRNNRLVPRDQITAVHRFHSPRILHDGASGEESNLRAVHALALDLLNQGGITRVGSGHLRENDPTNAV